VSEVAVLADGNPLLALRGPDGRWSARDIQKSGHVHATWQRFNAAVKRGHEVVKGKVPGHDVLTPGVKDVITQMPTGGVRITHLPDYRLDEWDLLAALQKSDIPEIDLWFTAAALQALGFISPSVNQGKEDVKEVKRRPNFGGYTAFQLAQLAALGVDKIAPDGTVIFGEHAQEAAERFLYRHAEEVKARAAAKAAQERQALPAPLPEHLPLPWSHGYDACMAYFKGGHGDWGDAAEYFARSRANDAGWVPLHQRLWDELKVYQAAMRYPDRPSPAEIKTADAYLKDKGL